MILMPILAGLIQLFLYRMLGPSLLPVLAGSVVLFGPVAWVARMVSNGDVRIDNLWDVGRLVCTSVAWVLIVGIMTRQGRLIDSRSVARRAEVKAPTAMR